MIKKAASALIGYNGFLGSTLASSRSFTDVYNSQNIASIAGRSFDLLVCCGAPSSMWEANQHPAADALNLAVLAEALSLAEADRLILISTIAVFDDMAAGYDERNAEYEVAKAYGRNRRALESRLQMQFPNIHVLRLPALFGKGLKKNFIFDILNPVPSFLRPERFEALKSKLTPVLVEALLGLYKLDRNMNMLRLDRQSLNCCSEKSELVNAIVEAQMEASRFTNSNSQFQYYDVSRLADDIDIVIEQEIPIINICSEPISAADIVTELTGNRFENHEPLLVREDVRSVHAGNFGGINPYLFNRDDILQRLKLFYNSEISP